MSDSLRLPLTTAPDFFIRVRETDLLKFRWNHEMSFASLHVLQDAPHGAVMAGGTEWTATFGGKTLTIGWDWYLDGLHEVRYMETVGPRSNILLIDAKGYDCDYKESSALLSSFIGAQFFWQATVSCLIRDGIPQDSSDIEMHIESQVTTSK